MSFLPEIRDISKYNALEAKLSASVRWLIAKVFEKEIPDKLREVIIVDEQGRLFLSVAVQTALTNGSLYGQAAARIFKDGDMLQHRVGTLLQALEIAGHVVSYKAGGTQMVPVTEDQLYSAEPFDQMAHIAMIDALMGMYVRRTCTIERAIDVVNRYTTVEDQERPMDPTDALLFWINKISLLVRDHAEKNGTPLKGGDTVGVIPEMEDLYEDICDGCSLCTLISFYHPEKIDLMEISFNEQMPITDCQYNLLLIQRFCDTLPCNPWHFSTEDILYMHESLQVNVNAFLADLFDYFEPATPSVSAPLSSNSSFISSSSPRRFVPIQGIPDLRAANLASRPSHPPKTRFPGGSMTGPRPQRSVSVMSADSLAGARPSLPLSARLQHEQQWGGNMTAFAQLSQGESSTNGHSASAALASFAAPGQSPIHSTTVTQSPYSRSDSLPAASIRLALEEKRREHERKKALASTMTAADRQEKGKAAFFALMNKHAKNNESEGSPAPTATVATAYPPDASDLVDTLSRQLMDLQDKVDQMNLEREGERMARATSQPSIYHDVNAPASARPFSQSGGAGAPPPMAGHYAQPYSGANTQNEFYYQGMQPQTYGQQGYDQPQFHAMRPSLSNGVLNYLPQPGQPMQQHQQPYDPYGMQQPQGYYTMQPGGMHQQQQPQQYGMPSVMHQSAHASFSLHNMQQQHPPRPPSAGPLQQPPSMPMSTSFPTQIAPPPQYDEALMMQQQQQLQQHQQHMMPPVSSPAQQQQQTHGLQSVHGSPANDGFRLHNNTTPTSRLDPPLELNRNLTNWGLTYRQGAGQRVRRTWENETFVKSEHDLVNQPENVPCAEDDQSLPQQAPMGAAIRGSRSREETPASVASLSSTTHSTSSRHGGSESESAPPRDPTVRVGSGVAAVGKENMRGNASAVKDNMDDGAEEAPRLNVSGPGGAFVVEDDDAAAQDFDDMRRQAKRDALMAKTMKRKEEITQKVDSIEARNAERRAAELQKQAMADQRKLEKEIQRQKILEEYKRRKIEKELGQDSARSVSSVGRGSSQPPFARTKSQGLGETPRGTASSSTTRARGQSNIDETMKIAVPSCAEPKLKLFAKATPKSNRNLITNALQFSVFPGAVSQDARNKVLAELAKSDSKHVLLLFRDHKCQYRGLYQWDQVSDAVDRLHGTGPKVITESMMQMMFKYESGMKQFNHIPTKHLSATIDGFTIKDEFWQKAKIPHSGSTSSTAPSHRDN